MIGVPLDVNVKLGSEVPLDGQRVVFDMIRSAFIGERDCGNADDALAVCLQDITRNNESAALKRSPEYPITTHYMILGSHDGKIRMLQGHVIQN